MLQWEGAVSQFTTGPELPQVKWCDSFMSILTGKCIEWDLNKVKPNSCSYVTTWCFLQPENKGYTASPFPKLALLLKMNIYYNN